MCSSKHPGAFQGKGAVLFAGSDAFSPTHLAAAALLMTRVEQNINHNAQYIKLNSDLCLDLLLSFHFIYHLKDIYR